MSSKSRPKNTSIAQRLIENPYEFSFLQAVRLLERSCVYQSFTSKQTSKINSIAQFSPPNTESIRFRTNHKLDFFSSEIASLNRDSKNSNPNQWNMLVNIMGLAGSMGVLPFHYTELIHQRLKLNDKSLLNFLDMFNHRTISLFYQAATKYKLPIVYEKNKLDSALENKKDPHTRVLLSLIGLGTKKLDNRLHTTDESLLYYSGLLTQQIKTSIGLKQILQRHFDIPVQINEFAGQWQPLIDDVRTRLPSKELPKGQNSCLGRSALIGKNGWFAQGKIRIILGPLNKKQLDRFAPGTKTLKAINEIVRLYAGLECNYDFIIRMKRMYIPKNIILDKNNPPIVSWNTWLPESKQNYDPHETVDVVVTSSRFI